MLSSLVLVLAGASCATAPVMPPAVEPRGEDRYLVDPRTGFPGASTPELEERMEAAWRLYLAGDYEAAKRRLTELRTRTVDYAPATLLGAAIDFQEGRLDAARDTINLIADQHLGYTAARVYQAEVELAAGNTRRAWEIYRSLSDQPDAPPTLPERVETAERRLFEELFATARDAEDLASIPLLREALAIRPGATAARLLLVRRLIGRQQYDEARRIIQPLVESAEADREDVQEMLAEIEFGRGRYQEAIVRYEALARRSSEPRFTQRLEEIKERWTLANMPPQYRTALEAEAITRADLAVLVYWKVSSVRFAQNLPAPPIATDITDVAAREEIIRAIAIGLYDVDPVTRRVAPFRPVTAAALSRLATRLLLLRRATCAGGVSSDAVLSSCGVTDPMTTLPADATISGRAAAQLLDQIDRALAR